MGKAGRAHRFTIWHAALLLPWAVAAVGFRRTFNDNSYLWHVRAGDLQIDLGSVVTSDPFSFTMGGAAWRTQSWLAELSYSLLDSWQGLDAAPWITTTMAVLMFIFLGLYAFGKSKSLPSVVLYLVATAIITAGFLNPRPVIFSFPLFAAVVVADDDRRLRWAVPVLMWLWASMHGSFVIGLAFLALRMLGRGIRRRRLLELVLVGVPTLLTAHGWGVVDMLLDFVRNRDALDQMSEWASPDLLAPPFIPLLAGFLILVWLGTRNEIRRGDWWLLVPFVALAVSANRAVPPAWIGLTPLLARFRLPLGASSIGSPVAAGLALLLFVGPFLIPSEEQVDLVRFPVEAATHLQSDRVFHDDATGGWLIYTQWPERKVYIDDRAELFGEGIVDLVEIRAGVGDWEAEFMDYGIDEVLLPVDVPLVQILEAKGWGTGYEDEEFIVLRQ
ncbi:MAG: hypothetical protein ACRDVD_07715 [Acidimicrobiia bacterium]